MDIVKQLLLQLILILLNAFFAATEIAVISLNEKKVHALADEGDKKAKKMLRIIEEPTRFLSTIQIGITLAGFLASLPFIASGVALAVQLQTSRVFWVLELLGTLMLVWMIAEAAGCTDAGTMVACLRAKTPAEVIDASELPERPSERITENFDYFYGEMEKEGFDVEAFWNGMKVLTVIDAELDKNDNPQLIFESLNARGVPLTTADLVRNYLLIAMDHDEQTRLYKEYWEPIEVIFGDDPGAEKLNAAIRTWLSIRFPKVRIHDKSETYSVFKTYIEDEHAGTPEELLEELRGFCFMWGENYKFHEVKQFRSMNWAKGKRRTLVPERASQGGF